MKNTVLFRILSVGLVLMSVLVLIPATTFAVDTKMVIVTNDAGAPLWSEPSSSSERKGTLELGATNSIIQTTVNEAGRTWHQITYGGYWIYDGNVMTATLVDRDTKYVIISNENGCPARKAPTQNVPIELTIGNRCLLEVSSTVINEGSGNTWYRIGGAYGEPAFDCYVDSDDVTVVTSPQNRASYTTTVNGISGIGSLQITLTNVLNEYYNSKIGAISFFLLRESTITFSKNVRLRLAARNEYMNVQAGQSIDFSLAWNGSSSSAIWLVDSQGSSQKIFFDRADHFASVQHNAVEYGVYPDSIDFFPLTSVIELDNNVSPPLTNHTVTVTKQGNGDAYATPVSASAGTLVRLTASPAYGYVFKEWVASYGLSTGAIADSSSDRTSFTMPANSVTVMAVFVPDTPTESRTIRYEENYDNGSVTVKWGASLFSRPSTEYNPDLALVAAALSTAADTASGDASKLYGSIGAYQTLNFANARSRYFNYDASYSTTLQGSKVNEHCFSIASQEMTINGKSHTVIAVVLRGTKSLSENVGDAFNNADQNFYGYKAWNYQYDYYQKVETQFWRYINDFDLEDKDIKVLITGHSLGGSAANLFAASFVLSRLNITNVYAYTFGALNSISSGNKLNYLGTDGYNYDFRYIYNIFNFYDSFGPGGAGFLGVRPCDGGSAMTKKFGHIMVFAKSSFSEFKKHDFETHVMPGYLYALNSNLSSNNVYSTLVKALCPVDVEVYNASNTLIGRTQGNVVDEGVTQVPIHINGDEKYIMLPAGSLHSLVFEGYDSGTMTYTVEQTNDTNTRDWVTKTFEDIGLYNGKQLFSQVGGSIATPNVRLFVTDDQGNKVAEIATDGTETPIGGGSTDSGGDGSTGNSGGGSSGNNSGSGSSQPPTSTTPSTNTPPPIMLQNPFSDVKSGDWFYAPVMYAYEKGLMTGTSTSPMLFSPDSPLTRGMVVTILHRMAGSPDASDGENPFSDVSDNIWYSEAVKWAVLNDIVSGYVDGKFGPEDNITRQDLACIFLRYMNFKKISLPVTQQYILFSDAADISDYASDAVQTLNKLGIINGVGVNEIGQAIIDPKGSATRAQVAAMLQRLVGLMVG